MMANLQRGERSRRRRAFGATLALGLALAACSGRPGNFLEPAAGFQKPPGGKIVDLMVATTRSPHGAQPGEMFTGERGEAMSFAEISISIPPDEVRQIGEVQWPKALPADPARDFVTVHAATLDRPQAVAKFDTRVRAMPGRRVLLFVHGYNTKFEEAVYRFAQITADSGAPAVPVLFTWPSRAKLLAYTYDRESANYSRDALESLLQGLAKDPNVGEVTVLAHSMGNWVTLEALHQMAVRNGRLSPKIANIALAAPDVDIDVFRTLVTGLGPDRPPITMFVSRDDKALAISRRVWGDVIRAGAIDPNVEPVKSELEKAKIVAIDLTDVKSDDSLNHSKFAESPEIVRLIGQRLAAGQTLTDSRSGLGERIGLVATGAAATVGSAAGVVLSAPIAIIDPDTRDSLGDRASDVGSGIGDTLRTTAGVATNR
jgi:esterase/lipase superfamily enzyme